MWYLYITEKNNRLYTGITTDIENRLRQHGGSPLLYKEKFDDKYTAARREREIKGWNKKRKLDLIAKFNK
jgi:putative endonuclease